MFTKLLIANRGEIACRVIRTARRLGIRTIAVYSDPDRDALHVEMADEARRLGPAAASQSYLHIERTIAAAIASGADAVHPGYGFLAENPAFIEACDTAGIVFVGPPAAAVRTMGLKDAAKRTMERAGVPVVPGYHGKEQDATTLRAHAERIGFPIFVKAAAGGGGVGLRRVDTEAEFENALEGARREARSSFGDDRVLIERCILRPRHIEVQIFADMHGNAVHLFERDCSLQRRHQKVMEEAPAPGMSQAMRTAMGAAAITAAQTIAYHGAGTVEFIADVSEGLRRDRFWFIEMNTRLQVEHPVTEMITDTDLVEWQLRVAAGEPLPTEPTGRSIRGHAVEARIYAEDPDRGFLPAAGILDRLTIPPTSAGTRIDCGVREGDTITPHYDPMIAKVIAHGENRAAALDRLADTLRAVEIAGVATNVRFLSQLVADRRFRAGAIDTGFIDRALDTLLARPPVPDPVYAVAAMYAAGALEPAVGEDPWSGLIGWRLWYGAPLFARLELDGDVIEPSVTFLEDGGCRIDLANTSLVAKLIRRDRTRVMLDLSDRVVSARITAAGDGFNVHYEGCTYGVAPADRTVEDDDTHRADTHVAAPLPGKVVKIAVRGGDAVERGATLITLEAMKMELNVAAPHEGVIGEVAVSEGDQVTEGTVLMNFLDTPHPPAP